MADFIKIIISNFPSRFAIYLKSSHQFISRQIGKVKLRAVIPSQLFSFSKVVAGVDMRWRITSATQKVASKVFPSFLLRALAQSKSKTESRVKGNFAARGVVPKSPSTFASRLTNIRILKFYKISERRDMPLRDLDNMTIQDFVMTEDF